MLATLLESHAVRQRRAGGAALSAAVHVAIIGAVAAATAHARPADRARPEAVHVTFAKVVAPTPVARVATTSLSRSIAPRLTTATIPRIAIPTTIPTSLPPIDLSNSLSGADLDHVVLGGGGAPSRSLLDGEKGAGSDGSWNVNEVLMHILKSATPRYPESLRRIGIGGRVLVRFTVDTTGGIDMQSVQILNATHDLFARAVREALPNFRFRPAEVAGRKVPALAEMPFEFDVH